MNPIRVSGMLAAAVTAAALFFSENLPLAIGVLGATLRTATLFITLDKDDNSDE